MAEMSYTIGVLTDWIVTAYHSSILSGIRSFTDEFNHKMLVYVTGQFESSFLLDRVKNKLFECDYSSRSDGLILLTSSLSNSIGIYRSEDFIQRFRNLPLVSLGRAYPGVPGILINNQSGMQALMNHLIEVHHYSNFVFISGGANNADSQQRFEIFLTELNRHGLYFSAGQYFEGNFLFQAGIEAIREFLDVRKIKFDAVIAANDIMASGAIEELRTRGYKVPGDFAVTGFDNFDIGRNLDLTTVKQPFFMQGRMAAEILAGILSGEAVSKETILESKPIIRMSCGCFTKEIQPDNETVKKKHKPVRFRLDRENILRLTRLLIPNRPELFYRNTFRLTGFMEEQLNSVKDQALLPFVRKIAGQAAADRIEISDYQLFLSLLSREILSLAAEPAAISRIESYLRDADRLLEKATEEREIDYQIISDHQLEQLNDFGEDLALCRSFDDINKRLHHWTDFFHIKFLAITFFASQDRSLERMKAFIIHSCGKSQDFYPESPVFNGRKLLPDGLLFSCGSSCVINQLLYVGEEPLGLLMMSMDLKGNKFYDFFRNKISYSIKNIAMIEEIREQKQNLENEVSMRTSELVETNILLKNEIINKQETEKQLKITLKELSERNKEIQEISMHDHLTGLYNRRGFQMLAEQHFSLSKRKKRFFLLIFADMDGLKDINDRFGHDAGDLAIIQTAGILKECFRSTDIVARIGGDEFNILAIDTIFKEFTAIESRMCGLLKKYNNSGKTKFSLNITLGAAPYEPGWNIPLNI